MYYSYSKINRMDSVYGTVVGGDKNKGVYIRLDNGEMAFADFGFLPNGTTVLCTYLKSANRHYPNAKVEVDSVVFTDKMIA